MKAARRILAGVVFFVLAATLGFAQTQIYIAQNATGANTGADCSNAHAAAWFNTAANWGSGAAQIGPGDTVHICGTITGSAGTSGILVFQGSGTAGNPITLKFETGASLSAPYCGSLGNSQGCLVMSTPANPRKYLVVDGGTPCGWTEAAGSEGACNGSIVNTANGTALANHQDSNGIVAQSCSNCEIKNLEIANIYVQSAGDTGANPQYQTALVYSGTNVSIHDNKIHDCGWCVWYLFEAGDSNHSVYNNDIYNTAHPVYFAANSVSGTATNAYYYSNHFHDYENWDTSACVYHVEGIHVSGPSTAPFPVFNGLYVYNNFFGPNTGTCLYAQVFFSPNTGSAGSAGLVNQSAIFNNVFSFAAGEIAIGMGSGNGNSAYNNTMIGPGGSDTGQIGLHWNNISENSGYTFTAENNAIQSFYFLISDYPDPAQVAGLVHDYNAYGTCTSNNCFYSWNLSGSANFTTYKADASPNEAHSIAKLSGSTCCNAPLGIDANFKPVSGSFLIGAGANLTSVCSGQPNPGLGALCYDKAGTPRPSTGAWDIGAYQDPPSSSGPKAPVGLAAVVQ